METKTHIRLRKLTFLLKQMEKIHLHEAAKLLDVSEMTLRRDLREENCDITLLGGYAVLSNQHKNANYYQIFEHQDRNIAEKMRIGKLAADLIIEDDVVFFDCGTTIPFIASQISPSLRFTALCCSINTFLALQDKPHCKLVLCGGEYSRDNSFFTPLDEANELLSFCYNKAFISAAGVDVKQGVTCFNLQEARVKKIAMAKSQKNILVFDHSKINQIQQAYIASLSDFNLVVCDQNLPKAFGEVSQVLISK